MGKSMNNTLNQFITKVKDGIARPAQFAVSITPPYGLRKMFNSNIEDVMILCDSTMLPGIGFGSNDLRTTGETFKMPFEKMYTDIMLNFYVDKDMYVKLLFDNWIELIQTTDNRIYQWPDNYKTIIEIYTFDKANSKRYRVKLMEAYPLQIHPIGLSYSNVDIMRLQTAITYRSYEIELLTSKSSFKLIPFDFFGGGYHPSTRDYDDYWGNIFI